MEDEAGRPFVLSGQEASPVCRRELLLAGASGTATYIAPGLSSSTWRSTAETPASNEPSPVSYTLTVTDPNGREVGSTTVEDEQPIDEYGEHVQFGVAGGGEDTADRGLADHLRLGDGTVVEEWSERGVTDYTKTRDRGGTFEVVSEPDGDGHALEMTADQGGASRLTSEAGLLSLTAGTTVEATLRHREREAAYALYTSVGIGVDAGGSGGIELALIESSEESTPGALIRTPNGRGRVKFTPEAGTAYTLGVEIEAPRRTLATLKTGWNESDAAALPFGDPDPDWRVTFDGRPDPEEAPPHDSYVVRGDDDLGAEWVTLADARYVSVEPDKANGQLPSSGTAFEYTTTFELPGGVDSPALSLRAIADDEITSLQLNGHALPFDGQGSFGGPPIEERYADPALFRAGTNRLTVTVEDTAQVETGLAVSGAVTVPATGVRLGAADTTLFQDGPGTLDLRLINETREALEGVTIDATVVRATVPGTGERSAIRSGGGAVETAAPVTVEEVRAVPERVEAGAEATFAVDLDVPDGTVASPTLAVFVEDNDGAVTERHFGVSIESPLIVEGGTILPLSGKKNVASGFTVHNRSDESVTGIDVEASVDSGDITVEQVTTMPESLEAGESHSPDVVLEAAGDAEGFYTLDVTVTADDGVEARGFGELDIVETVQVGVDAPIDGKALESGESSVRLTFDIEANQFKDVADVRVEPKLSELPGIWAVDTSGADLQDESDFDGDGGSWSFGGENPVWTKDSMTRAEEQQPYIELEVPDGIGRQLGGEVVTLPTTAQCGIEVLDPEQELVTTVETDLNVFERFIDTVVRTPTEKFGLDEDLTVTVWFVVEDTDAEEATVQLVLPPGFDPIPPDAEDSEHTSSARIGEFSERLDYDPRRPAIAWDYDEGPALEAGTAVQIEFGVTTPEAGALEDIKQSYSVQAKARMVPAEEDLGPRRRSATGQVYLNQFAQLLNEKQNLAQRIDRYTGDGTPTDGIGDSGLVKPVLGGLQDAKQDDPTVSEAAATDAVRRLYAGELVAARQLEITGNAPFGDDDVVFTGTSAYDDPPLTLKFAKPAVSGVAGMALGFGIGKAVGKLVSKADELGPLLGWLGGVLDDLITRIEDSLNKFWALLMSEGTESAREELTTGAIDLANNWLLGAGISLTNGLTGLVDAAAKAVAGVFVGHNEQTTKRHLEALTGQLDAASVESGLGGDQRTAIETSNAGIDKLEFLAVNTFNYVDTYSGVDFGAIVDEAAKIKESIGEGDWFGALQAFGGALLAEAMAIFNTFSGGLVGAFLGMVGNKAIGLTQQLTINGIVTGKRPPGLGTFPIDLL